MALSINSLQQQMQAVLKVTGITSSQIAAEELTEIEHSNNAREEDEERTKSPTSNKRSNDTEQAQKNKKRLYKKETAVPSNGASRDRKS